MGGSFNPAHDGHRHISLEALRRLRLDAVWWLVSPQNPLKPTAGMAPLKDRLAAARRIAGHPAIRVTAIEERTGTRYTVDTVTALKQSFPNTRFVWLMGADNLVQLPQWQRWRDLFHLVPIAVFDRAPYSFRALAGEAARAHRHRRCFGRRARALADQALPAWAYFHTRQHPASATAIRARRDN